MMARKFIVRLRANLKKRTAPQGYVSGLEAKALGLRWAEERARINAYFLFRAAKVSKTCKMVLYPSAAAEDGLSHALCLACYDMVPNKKDSQRCWSHTYERHLEACVRRVTSGKHGRGGEIPASLEAAAKQRVEEAVTWRISHGFEEMLSWKLSS
jgi:hypothetical protein